MPHLDIDYTLDTSGSGSQANIDAVAEVRVIFEKFKAIFSMDPADIPGIGPNLIYNPGAESGSSGWLVDIYLGEGDYTFDIPYGGAHSGDRSFKIECTGASGLAARWYQINVPLTVGKKYAVRFWFRASGGAYGKFELYQGSNYTPIAWQDSGDEWVSIVLPEFTAVEPILNLYPTSNGPGTVYFDDIFIAKLPD